MGQKVHPNGFRLGVIRGHRSSWYASADRYPELLQEDYIIRSYLKKSLANAGLSNVVIERKADQVDLTVHTSRPGVVVGRGGAGIDALKAGLLKELNKHNISSEATRTIRVNVVEVTRVDGDAPLIAEGIAQQLERRVAFRRIVRQVMQRAQRAGVQGIKIQISGRLNGAEIARTEWQREGRIPLHTLRADIDYAHHEANTTFGIIGVKVWVFRGEILPGQLPAAPTAAPRGNRRGASKRPPSYEDRSEKSE
ncbi:MAG: 30S ribosomal protein S3 [Synechococcaceae cyanobacterium SM2_3_60]|nr:30S ribosomal protein S3 [Synechococcaceae cyanobacterium SM2_3_60]